MHWGLSFSIGFIIGAGSVYYFPNIDTLNKYSGAIQAITTVILVLITTATYFLTNKAIKVSQQISEDENRPHVAVSIIQREDWHNLIELVIGNYGVSIASDITFHISKDIILFRESETLNNVSVIKNGIPTLVPRQVMKIPLLSLVGRYEELANEEILVTVSYKSHSGAQEYNDKYTLNFASLIEHQIGRNPEYQTADNIEGIKKILEKIEKNLRR